MNHALFENKHLTISPNAHALPGFRKWATSASYPEHGSISLISGQVVIDMNAERLESHNKVKTEIARVIANLVAERGPR